MADAWTVFFYNVESPAAIDYNMASVLNRSGTEVLKIRRVSVYTTRTNSTAGSMEYYELRRYTSADVFTYSQDTQVVSLANDPKSAAPSAAVYASGYASNLRGTYELLRNVVIFNERITLDTYVAGNLMLPVQSEIPLSVVWDAGYRDASVQPLTLRASEMITLWKAAVGGDGPGLTVCFEFTKE
jgi:hypothetical protein